MKNSLNEIILRNLMTEREMAIACGNVERYQDLQSAIEIHLDMMRKEVDKKVASE